MLINSVDEHHYFMTPNGEWSKKKYGPDISVRRTVLIDTKLLKGIPCKAI